MIQAVTCIQVTLLLWFAILHPVTSFSAPFPSPFPNSRPVTEDELVTMEKQTGQKSPCQAAIGVPVSCKCGHGYPQAFTLNPMPSTGRINSGLVKLTCPMLVNAIDELEDDGYIKEISKKLEANSEWQEQVKQVHEKHAHTRKQLITDDKLNILQDKLGERASLAFMESGVAASTIDSLDVKCLHAWYGDYLFTSPDKESKTSPLGEIIGDLLRSRGIDLAGSENCSSFCDPLSKTMVQPPNPRNKQRLKSRKEIARRKRKKENVGDEQ